MEIGMVKRFQINDLKFNDSIFDLFDKRTNTIGKTI